MVVVSNNNLKPEVWDCNLDAWLSTFEGNVWFVPGTYDQIEAWWDWEKVQ